MRLEDMPDVPDGSMSDEEFIAYAHDALSGEALECLYETISEHNGEVARFGDSWPGALIRIHASIAEVRAIERTLAKLEQRDPRDFRFSVSSPR